MSLNLLSSLIVFDLSFNSCCARMNLKAYYQKCHALDSFPLSRIFWRPEPNNNYSNPTGCVKNHPVMRKRRVRRYLQPEPGISRPDLSMEIYLWVTNLLPVPLEPIFFILSFKTLSNQLPLPCKCLSSTMISILYWPCSLVVQSLP